MAEILERDPKDSFEDLKPLLNAQSYQRLIREENLSSIFLLLAKEEGKQVGALYAHLFPAIHNSLLQYIYVLAPYRNKGIGSLLFETYVKKVKQRGITSIHAETEQSSFFDKRFPISNPLIKRYSFEVQKFHPLWFEKSYSLNPLFELVLWKDLSSRDLLILHNQENQGTFPYSISPFGDEGIIEPLNSLALKLNDRVVGWMITHRMDENRIRYSALYIEKEFRSLGSAIYMLIQAIRKQQSSPIPWSSFDLRLDTVDPKWIRFVNQRLAPYAQKKEDIFIRELYI